MKCSNPNCNFDVDGSCIEGLSLGECPSLSEDIDLELISPESLELETDVELVNETVATKKQLLIGQSPLREQDASDILKANSGKVISFVGPVGVGKTTLISSIYDIFNRSHNLDINFGRSFSLYAFEKLCHSARVTSKGTVISTPRTSSSNGVGFYHISIIDSKNTRQEVLLADRSGESYIEMINDTSMVYQFNELKRSDLICVLVDSSDLGNVRTRHKTCRQTINLLKSVSVMFNQCHFPSIALLLTKYDLVENTEREESCLKEAEKIKALFIKESFITIPLIPLAARPSLEENGKPDKIGELWSMIETSNKPQIRKASTLVKSERSFYNLELLYD